jgi:phosphate:Na+ symporter
MNYMQMFSLLIGGLALFLLGMKYMSEGMQGVAGSKLRKMVASVTDNRLKAVLTGTGVTCIIQSSSVTSVMVISMVNAGLMTLQQAIGVILGADIGTTLTAWIVALNIVKYGLPMMGLAVFFFLFAKSERVRYTGMLIMGLGMVFFGLELMKDGLVPIKNSPSIVNWFAAFEPTTTWGVIKCVLVGSIVTAAVQSSSATIGITITLARTGIIDLDTAAALVLGQNIGTTMTAALASLGATRAGLRTAYAHILSKTVGVLVIIPFFFPYLKLVKFFSNGFPVETQIALAHTLFNIILVLMFLPFVNLLAKVLTRLVPDSDKDEKRHLCYFDNHLIQTPVLALQQSANEILRMRDTCTEMLEDLKASWMTPERDEKSEQAIFKAEDNLDVMQTEIVTFISNILMTELPQEQMETARSQLRLADEYESVSDYLASLQKLLIRLKQQNIVLHDIGKQNILNMHDQVASYLKAIGEAVEANDEYILQNVRTTSDQILGLFKEYRKQSMDRLAAGKTSPVACVNVMDALLAYRKIKDHGFNIAEAISGVK